MWPFWKSTQWQINNITCTILKLEYPCNTDFTNDVLDNKVIFQHDDEFDYDWKFGTAENTHENYKELLGLITIDCAKGIQVFHSYGIQLYLSAIGEVLQVPVFQDELPKTHGGLFHQYLLLIHQGDRGSLVRPIVLKKEVHHLYCLWYGNTPLVWGPPDRCPCSLLTSHSNSSYVGTESSIGGGGTDMGIFSPKGGGGTARYSSSHSAVILLIVTQAGGRAWSTASW